MRCAEACAFIALTLAYAQALKHVASNPAEQGEQQEQQAGLSRPGVPNPLRVPSGVLYSTKNQQNILWGERLLSALSKVATEKDCGGFVSFGDMTLCAKAMGVETAASSDKVHPYGPVLTASHPRVLANLPSASGFLSLSFGIRERDVWSEVLSNRYTIPAKLHDCFWDKDIGPMGSKSFLSPSFPERFLAAWGHSQGDRVPCRIWREGICYGAPYETSKVCLGDRERTSSDNEGRQMKWTTINHSLKGRPPLSTFVKMDIEGSEWDVLEQLLDSPEDLAKIRTMDMEAHLNKYSHNDAYDYKGWIDRFSTKQELLEWKVQLMERLMKTFAVAGSTVDAQAESARWTQLKRVAKNSSYVDPEPKMYLDRGYSMDQFCVSLVNRHLL